MRVIKTASRFSSRGRSSLALAALTVDVRSPVFDGPFRSSSGYVDRYQPTAGLTQWPWRVPRAELSTPMLLNDTQVPCCDTVRRLARRVKPLQPG